MASTASGTTMEAPSEVMVPETLMTGRRPILLLISSVMSFSCLCDAMGIDTYAIIM